MTLQRLLHLLITLVLAVAFGPLVWANPATATVAVAANFSAPMQQLKPLFEKTTSDRLKVVIGSTGQLYAQISNGAPFDVFLAADQRRPRLLGKSGQGLERTRFTYATGRLTLWSADPDRVGRDGAATLKAGQFQHLAMANPKLAPYGLAARQALEKLGLWRTLQPKLVQGENIGKTFQLVATRNAELGFVALSYVLNPRNAQPGSRWDVPAKLYQPIRQDAILLKHGADNPAARAFLAFLQKPATRRRIERYGYAVPKG